MEFSIALYSLHRAVAAGLDICQIPRLAATKAGITMLDPTYPMMPINDPAKRKAFIQAVKDAGCTVRTVMVGKEGDLATADAPARKQAVENHRKWFDIAKEFGAIAFRANTGGPSENHTPDDVKRSAESFVQLAAWGKQTGVSVMIENHGGISGDPDAVVQIIKASGNLVRTAPDFGNFKPAIRYEGLAKLMPYAIAVHAKLFEFDAGGQETRFDLPRCMQIVKDAKWTGPMSIEFEGPVAEPGKVADEWEGIAKSKALLTRYGW
jgi:sugar phosphate isomerase/epimerase